MHRICRPIAASLRRYSLAAANSATVPASPRTIAVAMSGGIDSAVSALLLQDQGHKVVGVFMKNWDSSDECGTETCDIDSDQKDMKEVCDRLGIPAYEVNFVKEYWNEVFSPFLEAYQAGLETPNPDAFCNRHVKFKHLLSYITNKLGIDTIATGHYSRTVHSEGSGTQLLKGRDPLKDQSYFLCLTKGEALQKVHLPIGHLTKAEVKAIAAERLPGLRVLTKHESMGICFIGKRDMRDFLDDYITLTPGRFIDLDTGRVVGTHGAFEYFTVGQKARLSGNPQKYYVVGRKKNLIQPSSDRAELSSQDASVVSTAGGALDRPTVSGDVYVVSGSEHPSLYSPHIEQPLHTINWIAGAPPPALRVLLERAQTGQGSISSAEQGFRCECKCRYAQPPTPCTIQVLPRQSEGRDTAQNKEDLMLRVVFDIPQRAITAGQILALYDGEVCLGGAVIAPQPLFVGQDKRPIYL